MGDGPVATLRPFIGGDWHDGDDEEIVPDKYSNRPVTRVQTPSRAQVEAAVSAAISGQRKVSLTGHERYQILARASALLAQRRAEFVEEVVTDSGFTVSDAEREVDRATETLLTCGEEAKRLAGEVVPLEGAPGQRGRVGFTVHHPLGVVVAITPFNSPLNTVAHKVGPALAAGNGVVLKPASQTPRTADRLLRLLLDAGLPQELITVLYGGGGTVGQWLTEDPRPAFYAFTGSTNIGEQLHRMVGMRRTQLEMGSLSSTVICADADLARCTALAVNAAFRKAGQVCTSIQRLYVEAPVLAEVAALLSATLADKVAGDPHRTDTFVGPVISPKEADRVMSWIDEATGRGADLIAGGARVGNVISPTVLSEVDPTMSVMCKEIFGPVVVLRPFDTLDGAIDEINDTPYGLAAGIFTRDIGRAFQAAERLHMGSVHINETSSSRVDLMPYTGAKASGMGTEGPRYAIREMSEERLITIGRP